MSVLSKIFVMTCCMALSAPTFAASHNAWVEVRSPHFVVVSDAGEKAARKTAVQFEQIRGVFAENLTVVGHHPSPVITIFAAKDEGTLRELLPEYWAAGHSHPGGIFFFRLGQFEAAVQLDAPGENPYVAIYHEYYHALTLPYFPNLPLWVAEGLAEFFGYTEVRGQEAHMGQADPALIMTLRQNGFIPLNVLFKVDHSSPFYNEQNQTSIFYAESWALMHYLMIGDRRSHVGMFTAYLDALQKGATPEEAAAKGFGDLGVLQENLEKYIQGTAFLEMRVPAPAKIPDSAMTARELSEAEVDAYRGGFEALRGHVSEAMPLLEEAVRLDPKLAMAHQNLGLARLFDGQRGAAQDSFSQAIALDPKNGLTRYLRAYLNFTGGFSGTGSGHDPQIEDDLRQSIAIDPNFAPPYSLLAVYLAAGDEKLPEALAMAQKAVSMEPGNATYEFSLAQVLGRMRRFDAAQIAAQRARANAIDPRDRANADQYLAYLERVKNEPGGNAASEGAATSGQSATIHPDQDSDMHGGQGSKAIAEGQIADVACNGNEIALGIVAGGRQLTLHARDYTRLTWDDDRSGFDKHEVPACGQLKGLMASIRFVVVEGKPYDGEIESVEIEK